MDDVLDEFDGQLSYHDILHMTYKEIGYLREHRRKHHPKEAKDLTKLLMLTGTGKGRGKKQPNVPPTSTQRTPQRRR